MRYCQASLAQYRLASAIAAGYRHVNATATQECMTWTCIATPLLPKALDFAFCTKGLRKSNGRT